MLVRLAHRPLGARVAQLVLYALLGMATYAHAAEITIAWDPNPAEEEVTGYVLYWGSSRHSGVFLGYDNEVDVGDATQYTARLLDGVGSGSEEVCFTAVAYNRYGLKSSYSDEVCVPGMGKPGGKVITLSWPDYDGDNDVDGADLALFAEHMGERK